VIPAIGMESAMDSMLIVDLVDLALANPPAPEARLEKMFDWYFARELEIVKWSLGVASGLLLALLPGMIDPNKFNVNVNTLLPQWVPYFVLNAAWTALLAIVLCGTLATLKFRAISERADLYVPSLRVVLTVAGKASP
jgi:hypothetical protein